MLETGYAACTYHWNKGATALSNMHSAVIVIDDEGIVLSCNIQDDLPLYYNMVAANGKYGSKMQGN